MKNFLVAIFNISIRLSIFTTALSLYETACAILFSTPYAELLEISGFGSQLFQTIGIICAFFTVCLFSALILHFQRGEKVYVNVPELLLEYLEM